MLLVLATTVFAKKVDVSTAHIAAQSFINAKMEGDSEVHLIGFNEEVSFIGFYVFKEINVTHFLVPLLYLLC